MKNKLPNISDSELSIMKVIWDSLDPISFPEIREQLNYTGWDSSTIRTMITRLVKKKAIVQEKKGFYLYSANINRDDFINNETENFVEKIFNGNVKGLISNLLNRNYIDESDFDELKEFWKKGGGGDD